jgi:hypothetical protein
MLHATQIARPYIQEDINLNTYRCENLKSYEEFIALRMHVVALTDQ